MRVAVYSFISPDVDLDEFLPEDPERFSFLLQALVGPAGVESGESVEFVVCTPRWLEERVTSERVIFGRALVIVGSPDVRQILAGIKAAIERVEAPTWQILARKISRLGVYEFEEVED
ncbi:Imm8 family immunity protein [Streptomyces sp. NPDC059479]|uniref:Imm8 family immunity protein n=1 Tax=Streptomyces sp. NPDC059479 TaxID=3346848 RepID=UPI003693B121